MLHGPRPLHRAAPATGPGMSEGDDEQVATGAAHRDAAPGARERSRPLVPEAATERAARARPAVPGWSELSRTGSVEPLEHAGKPVPEGAAVRASRERPVAPASAPVPRSGSVVPVEHPGATSAAATGLVHAQSTAGEAAPGPAGAGADPFEDLDDLAERVGTILREEARRSGIDV